MKLYLAASSAEIARARLWRDRCVAAGIEVVSSWIENVERVGDANPRDATRIQRQRWADACLTEIDRCGMFWLLFPRSSFGAGVEFGYLIGEVGRHRLVSRFVLVSGDTLGSIFSAYGTEYATDEEAFAAIVEEAKR